MTFNILKPTFSGGVAVVTISRPSSMNALNSAFFTEFNHFLDSLDQKSGIRVLVITGEGKAFVAGADIAEMVSMDPVKACSFSKNGQETFSRLENLKIPVIAAINGYALGGGCELAMACDFRIASREAKIGQPELNLGLIPGYAGTQRLSRIAGLGNALYLILSAEAVTAEEALRMGLVQKVTEPGELMDVTLALAAKIAANGSAAPAIAKRVIRAGYESSLEGGSRIEAEAFSGLFDSAVTREGMKAFLEKRKPDW